MTTAPYVRDPYVDPRSAEEWAWRHTRVQRGLAAAARQQSAQHRLVARLWRDAGRLLADHDTDPATVDLSDTDVPWELREAVRLRMSPADCVAYADRCDAAAAGGAWTPSWPRSRSAP